MSVNQRIKFLIDSYENGNKSAFARKIGVSPTLINTYLPSERENEKNKRVSSPGFEQLFKILEAYPKISPDWLILGKGKEKRNSFLVPFVTRDDYRHYSSQSNNEDFINSLGRIEVPFNLDFAKGNTERVYEVVEGQSWLKTKYVKRECRGFQVLNSFVNGLHEDSIVITFRSDKEIRNLNNSWPYLVVTKDSTVLLRLVTDNREHVEFVADSKQGESFNIKLEEVEELWLVVYAIINEFPKSTIVPFYSFNEKLRKAERMLDEATSEWREIMGNSFTLS